MYTAFVIAHAGVTAGIAVQGETEVQFFASEPALALLERRRFPDMPALQRAIASARAATPDETPRRRGPTQARNLPRRATEAEA